MTRVDALSNAYIDQIKRELVAKGAISQILEARFRQHRHQRRHYPLASGAPELNTNDPRRIYQGVGGGKFARRPLHQSRCGPDKLNPLTDETARSII